MANCVLCETKLGFTNKPTFGQGKLKDGNEVCYSCFKKNGGLTSKFKELSTAELKDIASANSQSSDKESARLNEIKKQIEAIGLSNNSTFFGRLEIKELPNILADNETIDNIVQGSYNDGQGILVSTDRRLLFVDKGLIFGLKVEDYPLAKIDSIQYQTGILFGEIVIHTAGNQAKIDNIEKDSARKFAEFVRKKLSEPKTNENVQSGQPSVLDQLAKLATLKEQGIVSEEEFTEQKKKLLEKL